MALIKCPKCSSDISNEAESCPKCGYKFENNTNNEGKPKKGINKIIIFIIIGIIVIAGVILAVKFIPSSKRDSKTETIKTSEGKVKIEESEAEKLELVDYNGGNFTMKIPKGWTVETGGYDMFYAIRAYDPADGRYQVYAILKAEPFLKNDQAKNWFQNYYNSFGGDGNKVLAKAIVLYKPTVEAFYSSFNEYTAYTKEVDTMYDSFNFPDLKNFAMVESFESNSSMKSVATDDKTLRGTFQDSKTGKNGEGLFMASIINQGSYMATGFDTFPYSVYNIMGISTGENDLINYQKILTESLGSIQYTDSFVNTTISNGQERTKNALAINASMQAAFDSYNSAWSARQESYDIISQKQSDATLSYERVYDVETGDIYKAYNGFTDDYTGDRYQTVTDNMYTEAISGYIEK